MPDKDQNQDADEIQDQNEDENRMSDVMIKI